jgi:hypothetical protein
MTISLTDMDRKAFSQRLPNIRGMDPNFEILGDKSQNTPNFIDVK